MVIFSLIQFSIPTQGPFTSVYFNWMIYNNSFCNFGEIINSAGYENKVFLPPILIPPPSIPEQKVNQSDCHQNKPIKKEIINEKCETEDQQYTPGNVQNKKFKKNQQNENRNIIPNIVNQILSYVQKKNKSESTTKRIFDKFNTNSEWTAKRFYLYQNMLKSKTSHYVNEQTMKIYMKTGSVDTLVYSHEEQQFYNKVSRILVFYFLNSEAQTSTLTSRRMERSKKAIHIGIQNQLREKLKQVYNMQ